MWMVLLVTDSYLEKKYDVSFSKDTMCSMLPCSKTWIKIDLSCVVKENFVLKKQTIWNTWYFYWDNILWNELQFDSYSLEVLLVVNSSLTCSHSHALIAALVIWLVVTCSDSWWLVIWIVCLFITVPFLFPLKVVLLPSKKVSIIFICF